MTIYVDDLKSYPNAAVSRRYGQVLWCHMFPDPVTMDLEELHQMAARIGMRRAWFQDKRGCPHYDLMPSRRAAAIRAGAVEEGTVSWMERAIAARAEKSQAVPT